MPAVGAMWVGRSGPIAGGAVWRDNEDTLITLQGWGGDETYSQCCLDPLD